MSTTYLKDLELKTVQQEPYNAESPLPALCEIPTPTALFYVRSNFAVPSIDPDDWRLRIGGAVKAPREFSYDDLAAYPRAEALVLMECAGNGRRRMRPVPSGVAWDIGAVSCAMFGGVPLRALLEECGADRNAVEVVFTGADRGAVSPGRVIAFERSMPLASALRDDVLIATHMNGEPLAPEHGYPVRLLVPGWYGVASVKWLVEIRVLNEPFVGHFQTERYVYIKDPIEDDQTPVRAARVRAVIAQPVDGATIDAGSSTVRGIAWSGAGEIETVQISTDGGVSWREAELSRPASPSGPTLWAYEWNARPGDYTILARATDAAGNTQPLEPIYNELGYGNNVVQDVHVTAR